MRKYEQDIVVTNDGAIYATSIDLGNNTLTGDEPERAGGKNAGPAAHQFLLSSIGTCVAITLRMYAQRKQWDLKKITVYLNIERIADPEVERNIIYRKLVLEGDLTAEQQERLLVIADKCPIHKLLTGKIEFRT